MDAVQLVFVVLPLLWAVTLRDMLAAKAVDYAQPSVTKVGGVTEFLKVAALGDRRGINRYGHAGLQYARRRRSDSRKSEPPRNNERQTGFGRTKEHSQARVDATQQQNN